MVNTPAGPVEDDIVAEPQKPAAGRGPESIIGWDTDEIPPF